VLSAEAYEHFLQFRIRCRLCGTIFCSKCKRVPYHKGFTCESLSVDAQAEHCRFCNVQLTPANTTAVRCVHALHRIRDLTEDMLPYTQKPLAPSLRHVCIESECLDRAFASCRGMHACGHPCGGIVNERVHLPCLQPACSEDSKLPVRGFAAVLLL